MDGPCAIAFLLFSAANNNVNAPESATAINTAKYPPAAAHATPSGTASFTSPPPMPRPETKYAAGHTNPGESDGHTTHATTAASAGGAVSGFGRRRDVMS